MNVNRSIQEQEEEAKSKGEEYGFTRDEYYEALEENIDALKSYFKNQYNDKAIVNEKSKKAGKVRVHKNQRKSKKILNTERVEKFWINLD